jgi:hypothetical protein
VYIGNNGWQKENNGEELRGAINTRKTCREVMK